MVYRRDPIGVRSSVMAGFEPAPGHWQVVRVLPPHSRCCLKLYQLSYTTHGWRLNPML